MKAAQHIRRHIIKYSLLTIIVALILFRLYLPTLAKNYANNELNEDPLYSGHVEEIKIHLWRGAYTAVDVHIERIMGKHHIPLIAAHAIDVGISWKELVHFRILAKVRIDDLRLDIFKVVASKPLPGTKAEKKEEAHNWHVVFKKFVPLDISSFSVDGDSIHYKDMQSKPPVDVYLDQLEIYGTNFTNSNQLSNHLFGDINFHARAMKSGDLKIKVNINPVASPSEFKASVKLEHLHLTDLNFFFTAYGKFNVKKGNFSLYSEMATADKSVKGYVKPIIHDLQVTDLKQDIKQGLAHAFWEQIVGAVGAIFKNHPNDQQAATIKFEGRIDDPKTDFWQIASSILHNMFIQPIDPKLEHNIKLSDVKKK